MKHIYNLEKDEIKPITIKHEQFDEMKCINLPSFCIFL